jgi:hypothetical protein
MSFKEKILELHPDFNGGDHSRVAELQSVIAQRRLATRRFCACGCGALMSRAQLKVKQRFYDHRHAMWFRFYRNKFAGPQREASAQASCGRRKRQSSGNSG